MASPRICSIPDCGKPVRLRGWCSAHYQRWCKHGDPLAPVRRQAAAGEPQRFVHEVAILYEGDDCLIWPFVKTEGYGNIWIEGTSHRVPRIVCACVHGPAPTPKHEVAHSCGKGRRGCCNPAHLRWATHAENEADKIVHGTHGRGERCSGAKLTEADVLGIRALKGARSQREIAEMFGVGQSTVSLIQLRKIWAWLD